MKNIVYIHGFNSSCKSFNYIRDNLPKHTEIKINYESNLSVEEIYANALPHIPDDDYSLIGHSLGGLIATLICNRNDVKPPNKLITISTPFNGSELAHRIKWFFPSIKILADISPFSSIIAEAMKELPNTIEFHNVITHSMSSIKLFGENDGVISVNSQKKLNTSSETVLKCNHFEILQDPEVVALIKSMLFRRKV